MAAVPRQRALHLLPPPRPSHAVPRQRPGSPTAGWDAGEGTRGTVLRRPAAQQWSVRRRHLRSRPPAPSLSRPLAAMAVSRWAAGTSRPCPSTVARLQPAMACAHRPNQADVWPRQPRQEASLRLPSLLHFLQGEWRHVRLPHRPCNRSDRERACRRSIGDRCCRGSCHEWRCRRLAARFACACKHIRLSYVFSSCL